MARKSVVNRELKREKLVNKYLEKRRALKAKIKSAANYDDVMSLQAMLQKLPLNSSAARHTARCFQCGRARGVYRKFKLCRICLRQQLMAGNVTGGRKSSW
ncbi:MAG: 30S ribosomal protein S14 [Legionellales bacterium RIFCSPHIGHO2_12_FULL_37_14]|nr:MAG: 30S ribosomal protein S14 [Legionellales bacterium RIFCSPHIGHO2_12_FULL_37_14]